MKKASGVIWLLALAGGVGASALAAGSGTPVQFMAVTAVTCLVLAMLALREILSLASSGASRSAISAGAARSMGFVFAWGALALFVTYFFVLPSWREWPVFCGAFAAVAAISFFFAATIAKDAERGKDDETLLKIGRILTVAQFAGTLVAIVGLLLDPDKQFLNKGRLDWAAQTIFFFGAIALSMISAAALVYTRNRTPLPTQLAP